MPHFRKFLIIVAFVSLITLPILAQVPAPAPAPAPGQPSEVPASKLPAEPLPPAPDAPQLTGSPQPTATAPAQKPRMSLLQAAIIGVVEGITEYLPVSSTAHIILAQRALGIGVDHNDHAGKDAADAFAVCVQGGAILAVIMLYAGRVKQGCMGLIGKDPVGLRLAINLMVGVAPALVIGLLLNKWIKAHLFGLWPVAFAWFVGGLAILYISRKNTLKTPSADSNNSQSPSGFALDALNWQSALIVGLAQCLAMWPGTSRSLVTIVVGVLIGMSLPAAVEFSFLLGVITLTAATAKDLKEHGKLMIDMYGMLTLFVGFFAAFISALGAIEWLVSYLKKHSMAVFGYYRIALAVVVVALILAKVIEP